MLGFLSRYIDTGLLVSRVGIGGMFLFHGFPKLLGGPEKWAKLGEALRYAGVSEWHTVFGFIAAFAEFFGGLAVLIGFAYRPACLLLTIVMAVAANMHLGRGEGLLGAAHALENAFLFFAAAFVGPGAYSVDKK
jgi:putative oxidoreductase